MDAFVLDAAAVGCIALGLAVRNRQRKARPKPSPAVSVSRQIRDLRRRHRRVARAIVELARECLARHPDGSFEAFTAREALRSYLPETLAAYLGVPKALRRARRAGGPSADDVLSRQLHILYGGLERIREADAQHGATRMAANGAFLNERFASPPTFQSAHPASVLNGLVSVLGDALRRT